MRGLVEGSPVNLTLGMQGAVVAQRVEVTNYHPYIIARQWNLLARNWFEDIGLRDPIVGGAYDPQPSPLGGPNWEATRVGPAANLKPGQIMGAPTPPDVVRSFIAASVYGGSIPKQGG